MQWPKDNTVAKIDFYGNFHAKSWQDLNLVHIQPPFTTYYDGQVMHHGWLVHRKIAGAVMAALNEVAEKCEHDQRRIDATGVSDFGGCFNIRRIAGSDNWSNHSWACAIDLSPKTNGFNMTSTLSAIVVDAFKRQGARWGGDYHGRKDPMHFEFVSPA